MSDGWPLRNTDEYGRDIGYGVEHLAMPTSVIPDADRARYRESFLLCRETGVEAVNGFCATHQSDACLSVYVRYNHVFEVMEKNFKDAMVKTRQHVG